LELMDFGSMHPKIISLTTSAMAKHWCNGGTNKTEELVSNSNSEEQFTLDDSDTESIH
jgi:hypothetical protein